MAMGRIALAREAAECNSVALLSERRFKSIEDIMFYGNVQKGKGMRKKEWR